MVNMQMSAEAAKEYIGATPVDAGNAPKYPYGLCICLNDDSLAKLGLTTLPEVGAEVTITARAIVTSVRSSQQMDGDKESGADLQITDMEVGAAPKPLDAKSMYPNSGYE